MSIWRLAGPIWPYAMEPLDLHSTAALIKLAIAEGLASGESSFL